MDCKQGLKTYLFGILLTLFSTVTFANPYLINNITLQDPGEGWILVGLNWQEDAPRIAVELSVKEDVPEAREFVHAYFYDQDRKLLRWFDRPVTIGRKNKAGVLEPYSMSGEFVKGEYERVYFPITAELKDKWKNVVIVFGTAQQVTALVYPEDKLEAFDFSEKSVVQ